MALVALEGALLEARANKTTVLRWRSSRTCCLLGLDGDRRPVSIDSTVIGLDAVVENRVLFGSVNAHASDWRVAVERLEAARVRWPGALEGLIGLRVAPDRFAETFPAAASRRRSPSPERTAHLTRPSPAGILPISRSNSVH